LPPKPARSGNGIGKENLAQSLHAARKLRDKDLAYSEY